MLTKSLLTKVLLVKDNPEVTDGKEAFESTRVRRSSSFGDRFQSATNPDFRAWAFDLDNTLYPHHCNLFAQIDVRMGGFIADKLNLPPAEARRLQKGLLQDYATTLQGLVSRYGIDAREFLSFVHDIDYGCVPANPRLASVLASLPGRKIVFTNATTRHAERVLERLRIPRECFDCFLDIAAMNFQPKPHRDSYEALLVRCEVEDPREVVMFDDLPSNLRTAHELGIATVLIDTPSRYGRFAGDERYIDAVAENVESFLEDALGFS